MLDLVDRLVVMDKGSIVADGPKDEILEGLKKGAFKGKG
jgi:ATP-binding cassette subfamily C protein LapB